MTEANRDGFYRQILTTLERLNELRSAIRNSVQTNAGGDTTANWDVAGPMFISFYDELAATAELLDDAPGDSVCRQWIDGILAKATPLRNLSESRQAGLLSDGAFDDLLVPLPLELGAWNEARYPIDQAGNPSNSPAVQRALDRHHAELLEKLISKATSIRKIIASLIGKEWWFPVVGPSEELEDLYRQLPGKAKLARHESYPPFRLIAITADQTAPSVDYLKKLSGEDWNFPAASFHAGGYLMIAASEYPSGYPRSLELSFIDARGRHTINNADDGQKRISLLDAWIEEWKQQLADLNKKIESRAVPVVNSAEQPSDANGEFAATPPMATLPKQPTNDKLLSEATKQKVKRSTSKGEAQEKIIAGLTAHHQYDNGSCINTDPIQVGKFAKEIEVSKSSVSVFLKSQFGEPGYSSYRSACGDAAKLANALRILNGEITPKILFNPLGNKDRNLADE